MKKLFLRMLVAGAVLLSGQHAYALTLTPPSMELDGNPGQTIPVMIKLFNETEKEVLVYPSYLDFSAKEGEAGEPAFMENKQEDLKQLSSWITAAQESVAIKPGDWKEVNFSILIPNDAEPGGHYVTIFFGPQKINAESTGVGINYQTGSLVLLNVSGQTIQQGTVKEFSIKDNAGFLPMIPMIFEARIENTGNVHFKPSGTVEVTNMLGKKTATLDVIKNQSGGNVLPRSIRRYDLLWTDDAETPPLGFFSKVAAQWKHFHFGKYTATLSVALPQGQTGSSQLSFWIFPYHLLLVIVVGMVLLFLLIKQYNRWITQKALKKSGNTK